MKKQTITIISTITSTSMVISWHLPAEQDKQENTHKPAAPHYCTVRIHNTIIVVIVVGNGQVGFSFMVTIGKLVWGEKHLLLITEMLNDIPQNYSRGKKAPPPRVELKKLPACWSPQTVHHLMCGASEASPNTQTDRKRHK